MRKKILFFIIAVFFLNFSIAAYGKNEKNITIKAKAIYAADMNGKVLYEYKADDKLAIASTTKIMTYLLSRELMEEKNIDGKELIYPKVKKLPSDAVKIGLSSKKKYSLNDLLMTMMAVSANDSAEALRYYFSGVYKKDFISLMNLKAKSLGMKETNFINACGITEGNKCNYSTAESMYKLAKETITKYPEVLNYTSKKSISFNNRNVPTTFRNILSQGIDGLKTGFTNKAGYCIVATAKTGKSEKDRVIIVILGEPSNSSRLSDLKKLIDYCKEKIKESYVTGKESE
ncbi:MAG: serine hydrolase [Caloramator sp.]|nr:serine hydrolase [Caloramator sp.]